MSTRPVTWVSLDEFEAMVAAGTDTSHVAIDLEMEPRRERRRFWLDHQQEAAAQGISTTDYLGGR